MTIFFIKPTPNPPKRFIQFPFPPKFQNLFTPPPPPLYKGWKRKVVGGGRNYYLYKPTLQPCIECFCHVGAGAPYCYLYMQNRLQNQVCRILVPALTGFFEPLDYCTNVASLRDQWLRCWIPSLEVCVQYHWVAPRLTQSFILPRLINEYQEFLGTQY